MRKYLKTLLLALSLIAFFAANAESTVIINSNGFTYGDSWDNPSDEVEAVLMALESDINGGTGDITLNIVNYGLSNIVETWRGIGIQSIILEEIAGYSNNTTFGLYDLNSNHTQEIFTGTDGKGATTTVTFGTQTDFGFYIDPNGVTDNRMYTEHEENTHDDYQVVIFEIVGLKNQYLLGWEDLDLNGGNGGDRDYQDMIIRATVNTAPVPEPATMLLFSTGLIGLAGFRKKFKKA